MTHHDQTSISSQLQTLNNRLKVVQAMIEHARSEINSVLTSRCINDQDPIGDFELEVEITYYLREDDASWVDDDDNILTERRLSVSKKKPNPLLDVTFEFPAMKESNLGPHCYLLHDLYDHDWGQGRQRLTFQECARIGEIQFDMIIRQQFFMEEDSDKWQTALLANEQS